MMSATFFSALSVVFVFLVPVVSASGAPSTYEIEIPYHLEFKLFVNVTPTEPTQTQWDDFKVRMDEWYLEHIPDFMPLDSFNTSQVCTSFDETEEWPYVIAFDAMVVFDEVDSQEDYNLWNLSQVMAFSLDYSDFIENATWPPDAAGGILWQVQWVKFVSDVNMPHPCKSTRTSGSDAVSKAYKAPPRETTTTSDEGKHHHHNNHHHNHHHNHHNHHESTNEASTTFESSPVSILSSGGVPMVVSAFLWTAMSSILMLAQII